MKKTILYFVLSLLVYACHHVIPPFSYYEKFYGVWKIKTYQLKNDSGQWITILKDTGRFIFYDALEDLFQHYDDSCKLLILYPPPYSHLFINSPSFWCVVSFPSYYEQFYWRLLGENKLMIKKYLDAAEQLHFTYKFTSKKELEIVDKYEKEKWILEKI
ncbi:MAG: hypothetical protein N2Z72_05945 [Bacteroidales bacterium]|nr:hypothetical protein [Bacteroidales bacterium]